MMKAMKKYQSPAKPLIADALPALASSGPVSAAMTKKTRITLPELRTALIA